MEWIKSWASTLVTITVLVGSLFAFDARYAHADDAKQEVLQNKALIEKTQQLVNTTTNNLRRSFIEDKVFEIEVKQAQTQKLNPIDQAIKARYLRQLAEIPK